MGLVLALTAGLAFWVAAWAFGLKSFDAFMVVIAIMIIAFAVRVVSPFVREQLGR
jgi:hypothetical protein